MITKISEMLRRFGAILEVESEEDVSEEKVQEIFKTWGVDGFNHADSYLK